MRTFLFQDHQLSEVFKGNWQLSGGHGIVNHAQALETLTAYARHGVNVFDVGDIYTNAEQITGDFLTYYRSTFGADAANAIRVHTKFVPDLNALHDLSPKDIRQVIERSLARLGVDRLHLVQFHWWDFSRGDFVAAAKYLDQLRKEGLIESIGLTNFGRQHIVPLLDAGIPICSNQIQFSLLDPRPLNGMLEFSRANNIAVFCYGTLAGGLLTGVAPEPDNRSHIKYGLMIDTVGEQYYRAVLSILQDLARKYQTTMGTIATRFVLQTPGVSSAILGARNTKHLTELNELAGTILSDQDYNLLFDLMRENLGSIADDVYSFERDITGPHGRIMKYNLNGMRSHS